jgi:hypothetical protein
MQPNTKQLTNAVKHVVYDAKRFQTLLKMMGTEHGAVQAVHLVLALIRKELPVQDADLAQLGVNTYLILVHMAEEATGHQADPEIVHRVIADIQGQHPAPQAPAPQGILGAQMGAQ